MSHGLGVWGPTGSLELDENSFTCRIVYSEVISPSFGGSYRDISIPGVTSQNSVAFCIPIGNIDFLRDKQMEPQTIAGGVRVWRTIMGNPFGNSTNSNVTMRLVVVRFK